MQPLISVIVPVYKVEEYLNQCVESIVNQTYSNLEIILVDDGSPDNCPSMCDEWAKRDSRIRVIHKTNGGLSDARNAGMAIATGEYIGFVDSDDWIHEDMYRLLYENMIETGSDIAACSVQNFYDDDRPPNMLIQNINSVLNTKDALVSLINENRLKQPVWYKLYKHEIIKDLSFPKGKYHEDVFWSYLAVANATSISLIENVCYYYRQRESSIMGCPFSLKRLDFLDAKVEMLKALNTLQPDIIKLANLNLWFSCIYSYQMSLKYLNHSDFIIAKNKILEAKKHCTIPTLSKEMNFKQKVWLIFSRISFIGTCHLRNIIKIGF